MNSIVDADIYENGLIFSAKEKNERRRFVPSFCQICRQPFFARVYNLTRGKGQTCSRSCAGTLGAQKRNKEHGLQGSDNPNWRGGVSDQPYRYKKRATERYPEKVKARKKVYEAIRSGKLERQPCEDCGSTENIHAHHEDYSKPLDVTWLCRSCHRQRHSN